MVKARHAPAGPLPGGQALPGDDVWDAVEAFARDLPACIGPAEQVRCALRAVRAGLGAGAAFWFPGASLAPVECLGDPPLAPEWCRAFARRLLDETPGVEGRLLRSELPPQAGGPSPRSAVMARLSKSEGSWLVAVNFAPARAFHAGDAKVLGLIRQVLLNQSRRDRLHGRLADTLQWLVQCLTLSIDSKLPHCQGHSVRVAQVAVQVGRHMGLPRPVLSDLYFAGLLHDIGMTGVREAVLLKPGPLNDEETAEVRRCPVVADRILAGIGQLSHLRPAVRGLHERYDGRGYPDGLAGEAIPLMARILSVADSVDVMVSPRPYHSALSLAESEARIADGAGGQWDPHVVRHFLACRPAIEPIWRGGAAAGPVPGARTAVELWDVDTSRSPAGHRPAPNGRWSPSGEVRG
jgi:HD-GYP domain-containing protein (c-di-GMP phosphodiesterase class II)